MARLSHHSLLNALRGSLGQEIVFKQYKDKTVVSKYPDMKGIKPSVRQAERRQLMREASAYGKAVLSDPVRRAAYEKLLTPGQRVYNKAVQAYLKGTAGEIEKGCL